MAAVFLNPDERRPRAAWRLLGQTLLFVGLLAGLGLVAAALPLPAVDVGLDALFEADPVALAAGFLVVLAAALGSVALAARWLDRRPLDRFGLRLDGAWVGDLVFGLVLGAVLMSGVFAVQLAFGWVEVIGALRPDTSGLARMALGGLVPHVAIGVYEEVLSRGYHLTNFAQGLSGVVGQRPALLAAWALASVAFGVLHLTNPGATALSAVTIVGAGLMLGLGYVLTGRLGLPVGLHITWNFFQGTVYGFPVSGLHPGPTALVRTEVTGPALATGGAFGPEGGLVGLGAVGLGVVATLWWARRVEGRLALRLAIADPERPSDVAA